LHSHQVRKGTRTPYLAHLMGVCALVLEDGGSEDEAIGALLHDAIEDHPHQGRTRVEIGERFGSAVLTIVMGCSDADAHPKPPWRERKERYLAHLRHAPNSVLRVSTADKLHNARAIVADRARIGDRVWARFTTGRDETLWYYGALARSLGELYPGPLSDELRREVERLARDEPQARVP